MKIDWKEKIIWFRTGKATRTGIYFNDIGREMILPLFLGLLVATYSILAIITIITLLLNL